MPKGFDAGDTAFVLLSAALVMLMTPGLAFFYGGMVRVRSALNMLMMSFVSLGIVSVVWIAYGYTAAFGSDLGHGLLGGFQSLGMRGITVHSLTGTVPTFAFAAFQLMFAVVTPALISGAIADRARFSAWMLFVGLWSSLVYVPVAHWVWGPGGWIGAGGLGALDFAGGTAVHINAGMAGLGAALVLGRRIGFGTEPMRPHSLPLVMLGSGLLWFGWFGFNAGSALAADGTAARAFLTTQVATGVAMLGWLGYERVRHGKVTSLGAASGAVAGLVAITPACAFVDVRGAAVIGLVAGVACAWAVGLKYRFGYDDSLDVVGVHAVGGLVGTLLIGIFGTGVGLIDSGSLAQLGRQAAGAFSVAGYSFAMAWLIAKAIDVTIGFRASAEEETAGVDQAFHAETAYDLVAAGGVLTRRGPGAPDRAERSGAVGRSEAGEAARPAGRTEQADGADRAGATGRAESAESAAPAEQPGRPGGLGATAATRRVDAR